MKRETTQIKTRLIDWAGGEKAPEKSHPAFGMIAFSRISSSDTVQLFGSEVKSSSTIRMRVCQGSELWTLSEKHFFADSTPLIEVEMTASQFAEAITTLNSGNGAPCTIRHFNREQIPDFKDEDTLHELIQKDLKADVENVVSLTDKLISDLNSVLAETQLSKAKKELLVKTVERLRMQVKDNMPFVLTQYQRALAKVTTAAKAEIDSFVTHVALTRGLNSLVAIAEKTDPPLDERVDNVSEHYSNRGHGEVDSAG